MPKKCKFNELYTISSFNLMNFSNVKKKFMISLINKKPPLLSFSVQISSIKFLDDEFEI